MNVPMQSQPVQRAAVSYSSPNVENGVAAIFSSGNGVVASCECGGVDQSGFFDVIKTIGDVAGTVGKVAGVLGGI